MTQYTEIFNKTADRRQQHLDFVGQERRKLIQNASDTKDQEFRDARFIRESERIDGLQKLA